MQQWKVAGCVAAAVAAGVMGLAFPGKAAPAAKPTPTIGFVDLSTVTDQIKQTPNWKVMVTKFEDAKSRYRDEIENLTRIRYLDTKDRAELDNLRAKGKASDAEKARIDQLMKASDQLDQEYQTLGQTEKLTDEQKARLAELKKKREEGINNLQQETDKRAESLRKLEADVLDEMQGKVIKTVGEIAQRKDLVLVLDRQAVLYGGQDLTQDVLQKLK